MTPANFLRQIRNLRVGGEGFWRDQVFNPTQLAVSGATRATTSSIDRVIVDANDESVILNFPVPLDYDQEADALKIGLWAVYVSGTSVTLDIDVVTKIAAGAAIPAALTITSTGLALDAAADNGLQLFDLTGQLDASPGDVLAIEVDGQVAGAGIAHILGAVIRYKSGLVAFEVDDRA